MGQENVSNDEARLEALGWVIVVDETDFKIQTRAATRVFRMEYFLRRFFHHVRW